LNTKIYVGKYLILKVILLFKKYSRCRIMYVYTPHTVFGRLYLFYSEGQNHYIF